MATGPHPEGLDWLSGYFVPSKELPDGYKESSEKSWYYEFLQYRETVKPNFGTNQASVDWVSDTYTAESRSSSQLNGIAPGTPADGTKCGGSPKETADALICMGAGVELHDMPCDDFSNDNAGVEQDSLTQVLNEIDMIREQDNIRKLQQSMEPARSFSTVTGHGFVARLPKFMAQERDRVATEGNHVKGRRRGLPLLLEAHGGQQEIMTCYDTGTHDNHMSRAKAIELGYTIEPSPSTELGFQLPNGKIIKAVGQVVVAVQFARQVGSEAASMTCRFNVFERLALPVLIGMTFLQATETITKYTSRMVDLSTTWKRSLRLCAVGNVTNQVACTIDGRKAFAAADTGSEIALVSGEYAKKHGLLRDYGCEELELADGSLEYTTGFADVTVRVSKSEAHPRSQRSRKVWKSKRVRFHVLNNLQFDVILDEETIDNLSIFEDGVAKILAAASSIVPSLSPIIHLRSIEASLMQARDTLGEKAKELRTSLKSSFGLLLNHSPTTGTPATVGPTGQSNAGPQNRVKEIPALISQLDQAENRRLDQRERRGASGADDVQKQRYELERTKLLDELRGLDSAQGP